MINAAVAVMKPPIFQKCALHIPNSSEWIARIRGPNYALYKQKPEKEINDDRTCVLAGWGVGHIFMYTLIAALVWKELFLIGLLWELVEYPFGASYALDLVYNGIGIGLGIRDLLATWASKDS